MAGVATLTRAQEILAAVRAESALACPPPPPPLPHNSIAAAKARLAPHQKPAAWCAPKLPLRAVREGNGVVLLPSGVRLLDCEPRQPVTHYTYSADGCDLPHEPAVFTRLTEDWPRGIGEWSMKALAARAQPSDGFNVDGGPGFARETLERASVSMAAYEEYCRAGGEASLEASPLYIFDDTLCERQSPDGCAWAADFVLPPFFSATADCGAHIPRHRPLPLMWLLVSATGSGTPVHCHPHTAAVNVLLEGAKLWVLLPPDVDAEREVLLRLDGSIIDEDEDENEDEEEDEDLAAFAWLEAWAARPGDRGGARVILQEPGETVYLPKGWWHCVLNLEASTALCVSLYLERDSNQTSDDS